ncbi:MAG: hypothetical protein JXO49_03140 [Deltaproteobacteria bacterium]|nr:hypothetical protein [Candidatus Anaeroferrophillus wilburensis]MBN2888323.1 hypothetical protein [Deltaproteobacteria bacterium]
MLRSISKCMICYLIVPMAFLVAGVSMGRAGTLADAVVSLFDQVESNLFSQGRIVVVLAAEHEVVVEFSSAATAGPGAELVVFDTSERRVTDVEKVFARTPKGVISILESAGSVSRALIVDQQKEFAVGDEVMIPVPVMAYVTPVKNLTGFQALTGEMTEVIALQLGSMPTIKIQGIAPVSQPDVDRLRNEVNQAGRYGLIVQPYLVLVNGQSKVQLKMISLFSGQSLGVLSEDFFAFPTQAVSPALPYPGQAPQPYLQQGMPQR